MTAFTYHSGALCAKSQWHGSGDKFPTIRRKIKVAKQMVWED